MTTPPGTRFGAYEILTLIGSGGMGEVYRARDVRLGRDVAIKLISGAWAGDSERLARFEREAKTLAALNHPNIAHIHGIEESTGRPALVMELVEGPTLADRIAKGPLPVDETLPIARQMAEALEAAHAHGIIHRDLKPANIKVRDDGLVKILDFGLAKELDAKQPFSSGGDAARAETITTPAMMTGIGVILGTAAYMSPEQAKGRAADQRCDVWAYGCVLYEMLSGRRAFNGEGVSDTLAAILRDEPDWRALPSSTPASVQRLLKRCLAKDPKHRIREIGTAVLEIAEGQDESGTSRTLPAASATGRPLKRVVTLAFLLIAAVLAGAAVWTTANRVPARAGIVRFSTPLDDNAAFTNVGRHLVAISPDGSRVAYVANNQIYLRSLSESRAAPIRGTEAGNGRSPFFSPDGQWLAFLAGAQLKKISADGDGAPVDICQADNAWGASWGSDDTILVGRGPEGIMRVPAAGGTLDTVIRVKPGEQAHGPQQLPGGDWVLFTLLPAGDADWNQAQIVAQSPTGGEREVILTGGRDARYLPSGHLVYAANGVLYAVRFNPATRRTIGGPVSMRETVADAGTTTGAAHFSVASNGALAYVANLAGAFRTLAWVDRSGHEEAFGGASPGFWYPRLSPDGTRVAFSIGDSGSSRIDLWSLDVRNGSRTRLTFEGNNRYYPVWTRDGAGVISSEHTAVKNRIRQIAANGSGSVKVLFESDALQYPTSLSPDGRVLAFYRVDRKSLRDLWTLPLDGSGTATPFLVTPYEDSVPMFSPDGRWIAYVSSKSGRNEIYVRPFPASGTQEYTISTDGGTEPVWGPNGRELFFRHGEEMMMAAVNVSDRFVAQRPVRLFSGRFAHDDSITGTYADYDISKDGKRFVMVKAAPSAPDALLPAISIVLNWQEELTQRIPK